MHEARIGDFIYLVITVIACK